MNVLREVPEYVLYLISYVFRRFGIQIQQKSCAKKKKKDDSVSCRDMRILSGCGYKGTISTDFDLWYFTSTTLTFPL